MTSVLTNAERLKFLLLEQGLVITEDAAEYISSHNEDRALTPSDYASTSGVILELEDDVWVNAPLAEHNPNFVDSPSFQLRMDGAALLVEGEGVASSARFWLSPAYHGTNNSTGEAHNSYGFTHTDRVRVSPIEGCAITCRFCDLPYEFRYRTKRVDGLTETVRAAARDPVQPAHHVLISGGTPRPEDYAYVNASYEAVISGFPDMAVDIMMVPMEGLLDVEWLKGVGVEQLSINLEIYNTDIAARQMPRKNMLGRERLLDFLEDAAEALGGHRVRSMLMVGLEPMDDTLAGVEAIAERGCVPVLSPFRPDPLTPLRSHEPPTATFMQETYLRAREITQRCGAPLGPPCIPCTHNTLTLAVAGNGDAEVHYGRPNVI